MSLKEAKALIQAKKDAQEKEKSDLEKANEKASNLEKSLNDIKLRDFKRTTIDQMIAGKKIKLPDGVSISDILDMVNGPDEDGILKSAEKLPKFFPFNASMGSGTNPANNSAKTPNIDEQITAAEKAGNWNLATQLKLKKQTELYK